MLLSVIKKSNALGLKVIKEGGRQMLPLKIVSAGRGSRTSRNIDPGVGARWIHPLGGRGKKAMLQEAGAKRGQRVASTCGQAKNKQSPEYLARDGGQK